MLAQKLITATFLILSTRLLVAQADIRLYQQLSAPAQTYRSLSGWHGGVQASLNTQSDSAQTAMFSNAFLMNADFYIDKLKSAFGFSARHHSFSYGLISTNALETYFSPKIKFNSGLIIMPSVSISYNQYMVNWDVYDAWYPDVYELRAAGAPVASQRNHLGLGTGIGAAYKQWFFASDFSHINRPDRSLFETHVAKRSIRSSFILGKTMTLGDFNIIPTISYHNERGANLIQTSINANVKWFSMAVAYEWRGVLAATAATCLKKRWRFAYTQVIHTESIGSSFLIISHEFGMSFIFSNEEKGYIKNIGLM